jgi:hypothetical protein
MNSRVFQTCFAVALALLCINVPVRADLFSLSTLPASGDVSGPPGSTIGWGYSISNNSSDWLLTTALNSGSFLELDAAIVPNPNILFDFPIIAPGATVIQSYVSGVSGLYEITWDPLAPLGFVNSGQFDLSGELFNANPTSPGAIDLGPGPDLMASYMATVVPEPLSATLVLNACAIAVFLRLKSSSGTSRSAKKKSRRSSSMVDR